jgi:PII-like signaling protein
MRKQNVQNFIVYTQLNKMYNMHEEGRLPYLTDRKLTERGAARILKQEGIKGATVLRVESMIRV